MSDRGEPKVSRKDFLNIVRVGVGAALAVGSGVEIGSDPHFVNALKVTKELTEAQKSNDPKRIYESRKLAMVWLFAETAIQYSAEMGLGKAGKTMEHYLYGNGETLDISFVFEKIKEMSPESFVGKLISSSIRTAEDNVVKNVNPENHLRYTKKALRDLKSETGLIASLDAESIITWSELRYSFGGAKYEIHAEEAYIDRSNDYGVNYIVFENGVRITVTDRYNWEKDWQISLPGKVSEVAKHVATPFLDMFYESSDLVEKTLKFINISDGDRARIMEIYSNGNRFKIESTIQSRVSDAVNDSTVLFIGQPDLTEYDFNLLKKIGAKDYDMKGYVNLSYHMEIAV